MRKLFWGYAACGVFLAGGVFATGWYASQYPSSVVGRTLHGASRAAERVNPITGFRTTMTRINAERAEEHAALVAEPTPEVPAVEHHILPPLPVVDPAPIVIREEEPVQSVPDMQISQIGAECPPQACPVAPLWMPRCDEVVCNDVLPMPSVEEAELLPMPADDDDDILPMPAIDEEQEPAGFSASGSSKLFEIFTRVFKKEAPAVEVPQQMAQPECREDVNRHRHYPGCPSSGPCMPTHPNTPYPETQPSKPCFPDVPEPVEPKKDDPRQEARKEILKKLHLLLNRQMPQLGRPVTPGCDTMEYRPTDGQLYDYGRGSL